MQKTFSIKDALRQGWEITTSNFFLLGGIALVAFLIQIIPNIVSESETHIALTITAIFVAWVLGVLINIGFIHIGLALVRGENASWNDLFAASHVFFWYVIASILYSLAIFGGLLLLVVPGIIFAIMFSLHPYLIVGREFGPIEALKESARLTKGVRLKLLGFWMLLGLINLLGVLALGIGLLITLPLTLIAAIVVYQQLEKATPDTAKE